MNWKKTTIRTMEYVFYGITAAQMALGVVWICCQFPHMQNWQESYEYLNISRTWVMDEYVSFFYPLLLRVCTSVASIAGIPFYLPVYVIQLAAAAWAGWYFVRTALSMGKGKAVWAAGYLVSFPFLLQFHMSVRVESLCVSGVLVLAASLVKVDANKEEPGKKADIKQLIGAGITSLSLIWLLPDMTPICIAVWGFYLLKHLIKMRKEKYLKRIAVEGAVFVLVLLLGLSVNALVQNPGSRGRIQKTFWAAAFQRVVTDYYSKSFGMWEEDVKALMTIEEALEYAKRSDRMVCEVGPMLEGAYGRERANELYRSMTLTCFRLRTRMVVYQIRDDLVDGALMPFSVLWQDNGERMSQTGWNYGRFRENAAAVAKVFWDFSILSLLVLLISGLIRKAAGRNKIRNLSCLLLAAVVQCLWNVLSTGARVSYANVLLVILFWCVLAMGLCLSDRKTEESC